MTGKLRILAALFTVLAATGETRAAESVLLKAELRHGDLQRVQVTFESEGTLHLKAEGKQNVEVPVQIKAQLQYDEKLLKPTTDQTAFTSSARYYKKAQATVNFREAVMKSSLRDDRRFIAAEAKDVTAPTIFSPLGPLSRDELDLVDVPGNSLLVDRLLPGQKVSVGQRWKLDSKALAALFALEAVNESDIECHLKSVEKGLAIVYLQGTISGAVGGVASEIRLAAKYNFDVERQRVSWFAVSMKEKRSIGHAQPGLNVTARVQMATSKASHCPELDDHVLADLNLEPDEASQLLEFKSENAGFQMLVGRNWHVMIDRQDVAVMRFVDRGDLIAQCNLSQLPELSENEPFAMEQFQQDIKRILDENFGEFVTASESQTDEGLHVMRVVASGTVSDLPIHWVYYHVRNPAGRRASCVFTMEANLVDRFEGADHSLISSFRFTEVAETAASDDKVTR
jgi:hypothetical protein